MSLIELMISMALGLMIVLGIGTLFVQNKQSYNQDEMIARMQEDARFALNTMVDDLQLAGFWADTFQPGAVSPHTNISTALAAGTLDHCGGTTNWMYVPLQSLVAFDHNGGTTIATNFSCIANANYQANTDAVAINRVLGESDTAATFTADNNTVYMESSGTAGELRTNAMAGGAIGTPTGYWQYVPKVYYVRNYADTAGDGIPTLCVVALEQGGYPNLTETCLARGVESLQIQYGIDTDGDGVANQYLDAPTATQVRGQLASVRVHLLMRSLDIDPAYTNSKTYTLGNLTNYTPNDNYYRRSYTTTVMVRNVRSRRCMSTGIC